MLFSHKTGLALAAFGSLGLAAAGHADINGFNNGIGFTANNTATPGLPAFSGGTATLTDDNGGFEAAGLFYDTPQNITNFKVDFTYQAGGNRAGDGFAFVLQNDPRGSSALGRGGGYLGYGDSGKITNSAAVEFNLYTPYGQGTRLGTNGDTGISGISGYQSTAPLDLSSGDPIQVHLTYDGTTLVEALTDPTANTAYSTSYTVDLAGIVGASTAFVGFTGGDASAKAIQTVSDFQYTPVPEASTSAGFGLLVVCLGGLMIAGKRKKATA